MKSDGLTFWRVCQTPGCRRHKKCSGRDPESCWRIKWQLLPDDFKDLVRFMVKLRHDGMPAMQAVEAAQAQLARFKETQAQWAAKDAPAAVAAPLPAPLHTAMHVAIEPTSPRLRRV
jgi:hypothetical protein